jgi:hypothetical protein
MTQSPCRLVPLSPCPSGSEHRVVHSMRRQRARRGAVLIMALVCLALIAALGGTLLRWAAIEHKLLRSQERASQAHWLAEAGLERAAANLSRDAGYKGETWDVAAADLPSGEAARVRMNVTPVAGEDGRRSIEVDVEYPLDAAIVTRVHKEIVLQAPSEKTP